MRRLYSGVKEQRKYFSRYMYMLPARCRDNRDVGKLLVMNLAYMNAPNEGQMLKKYLLSDHGSGDCDA